MQVVFRKIGNMTNKNPAPEGAGKVIAMERDQAMNSTDAMRAKVPGRVSMAT